MLPSRLRMLFELAGLFKNDLSASIICNRGYIFGDSLHYFFQELSSNEFLIMCFATAFST